jgi:UDP-N-acetylmuramate dehydrogenase
MIVKEHASLKDCHTFGIQASARFLADIHSLEDLQHILSDPRFDGVPRLVLGGGSNVLFTGDYPGIVLRICLQGIEVVLESQREVLVKAAAGEDWDGLVAHCVERGWGGLENLSLIPGRVGAGPMQNIGAYGVELKDVFYSLEAYETDTGRVRTFGPADCRFGYRTSLFKQEGRGHYIILGVTFRLGKAPHRLHTDYGALREELQRIGAENPDIRQLRQAVIRIRQSKLPDPDVLGNAGSFFKNPVVSLQHCRQLQQDHPGMPAYPDPDGMKLAAGWLIEKAGWKGFRKQGAGVHAQQALVLVNYGGARGSDITALAARIQASVEDLFGLRLEPEVNII